jgi:hypothetical protein
LSTTVIEVPGGGGNVDILVFEIRLKDHGKLTIVILVAAVGLR